MSWNCAILCGYGMRMRRLLTINVETPALLSTACMARDMKAGVLAAPVVAVAPPSAAWSLRAFLAAMWLLSSAAKLLHCGGASLRGVSESVV